MRNSAIFPYGVLYWCAICQCSNVLFWVRNCAAFVPFNGFSVASDGCSSSRNHNEFGRLHSIGKSLEDLKAETVHCNGGSEDLDTIRSLTQISIYECGRKEGLGALRELNELCSHRLPFHFEPIEEDQAAATTSVFSSESENGKGKYDPGERAIAFLPSFLPHDTVDAFLTSVRSLEDQGWMSTNPDSVDGLPSLHVNLVSDGKPLFEGESGNGVDPFQDRIVQLYNLVRPYVYEELLPQVDRLIQEKRKTSEPQPRLRVSDVFLRRYGQDICGNVTRNGISIHYDVFSRVTAVIALDEVAAMGDNGLFTLVASKSGETSNHKALRRFFPLQTGDCVVHTWDVLHGVDVEAGLDRTSLIVWFDEVDTEDTASSVSPWLSLQPPHSTLDNGNDVRQFVLASALSSSASTGATDVETRLYLKSAARGNVFALARMGSIFEEGIPPELEAEALALLDELRPMEELPSILQELFSKGSDSISQATVASCRFWLEASLSGNPLAQKSLGDEIMFQASRTGNSDQRLLAAVLFALAAQQEDSDGFSSDALSRVVEYDLEARNVESQEEFWRLPWYRQLRRHSGDFDTTRRSGETTRLTSKP